MTQYGIDSEPLVLYVVTMMVVVVAVIRAGRGDKPHLHPHMAETRVEHEFRPAYGLSDPQAKGHTQSLRPLASLVPPSFPLSAAAMPGSLPTSPWLQLQSLIKVNCDYFS